MNRSRFSLLLAVSVASTLQGATITDLGTLGQSSYAYAVNASGEVAGDSFLMANDAHAFLYTPGSGIGDLGTLGGTNSFAYGIDGAGQIVGFSDTNGGGESAFLYVPGTGLTNLGATLGAASSYAYGINDSGEIVGQYGGQPFAYTTGTGLTLLGNQSGVADAVNAAGDIAGESNGTAFVYSPVTGFTNLGTLGGSISYAKALNASGEAAGYSYLAGDNTYDAFVYSGGSLTDLAPLLPASSGSQALGIDDSGDVVGYYTAAGSGTQTAFLYSAGVAANLNTLLPAGSGWQLDQATAITDSGLIVGYGIDPSGHRAAFLLDIAPVPEPATWLLFIAALPLLRHPRKVN